MPGIRNSQVEDRFIVYKHTNTINNKCYIGITKRSLEHRIKDGYDSSTNFNSALKKYGWETFKSEVLERGLTCEEACQKEQEYIIKFNSIVNGYNLNEGGFYGKQNEASLKKMSARMMGNTYSRSYVYTEDAKKRVSDGLKRFYSSNKSEEARKKISEANRGKVVSKETREKRSESLKGRVFSEETLKKMRDIALNRSDEWNKKISESKKGKVPWNKGKKYTVKERTQEQKENYRKAALSRTKEHQEKINKSLRERKVI